MISVHATLIGHLLVVVSALSSTEVAISVEHLSKLYFIKRNQVGRSYIALRDLIMDKLRAAGSFRMSRTAEIERFWALRDVTLQVTTARRRRSSG